MLTLIMYSRACTSSSNALLPSFHTHEHYAVRPSLSFGLSLNLPTLPLPPASSSTDPALDTLAKLQLSAVGVISPESPIDPVEPSLSPSLSRLT